MSSAPTTTSSRAHSGSRRWAASADRLAPNIPRTPFSLWSMSNVFGGLPVELEEQARVDGCSRLGALVRVVLPLARPGIVATALFGFLLCWDEFLYALIFTSSDNAKTIPVAIAEFTGRNAVDFGLIAAGGVLAALPPLVLTMVFQRYFVSGLSSGAVRG